MKKLYTLLTVVILTASAMAQAPEKMSYQAVVRDAGNALVTSQAVGMQINILQGSVSGTAVYVETQIPTTNINGLVSLEIGSGTVVSGTFNTIDWSNGPYFIKTETDPTGGTNYTITGTSQLMSVPYALHANTADSILAGGCNLSIGGSNAGGIIFYLDASGCHGLVAKGTDEPSSYQWSSSSFNTWAFVNGIYGGIQNTNKIIYQAGVNSSTSPAASVCDNLISGGYNDWYLPSKDELDLMYVNLHLQELGGFADLYYWSSTEGGSGIAWLQGFGDGSQGDVLKFDFYYVRAIRAF